MAKAYAYVVGLILLVVGIIGFVKGDAGFMGLHFTQAHNAVHCLTGMLGLVAGMAGGKSARLFAQVFGAVYTLVAILGFLNVSFVMSLLMVDTTYNVIHLAVGLLGLLVGFAGRAAEPAAA